MSIISRNLKRLAVTNQFSPPPTMTFAVQNSTNFNWNVIADPRNAAAAQLVSPGKSVSVPGSYEGVLVQIVSPTQRMLSSLVFPILILPQTQKPLVASNGSILFQFNATVSVQSLSSVTVTLFQSYAFTGSVPLPSSKGSVTNPEITDKETMMQFDPATNCLLQSFIIFFNAPNPPLWCVTVPYNSSYKAGASVAATLITSTVPNSVDCYFGSTMIRIVVGSDGKLLLTYVPSLFTLNEVLLYTGTSSVTATTTNGVPITSPTLYGVSMYQAQISMSSNGYVPYFLPSAVDPPSSSPVPLLGVSAFDGLFGIQETGTASLGTFSVKVFTITVLHTTRAQFRCQDAVVRQLLPPEMLPEPGNMLTVFDNTGIQVNAFINNTINYEQVATLEVGQGKNLFGSYLYGNAVEMPSVSPYSKAKSYIWHHAYNQSENTVEFSVFPQADVFPGTILDTSNYIYIYWPSTNSVPRLECIVNTYSTEKDPGSTVDGPGIKSTIAPYAFTKNIAPELSLARFNYSQFLPYDAPFALSIVMFTIMNGPIPYGALQITTTRSGVVEDTYHTCFGTKAVLAPMFVKGYLNDDSTAAAVSFSKPFDPSFTPDQGGNCDCEVCETIGLLQFCDGLNDLSSKTICPFAST